MKYLLLLSLIFLPLQSIAQIQTSAFDEVAVIELSPENPSPRETVYAKVQSSQYEDITRANIIWYVDGVEKKRGLGERAYQFQAPSNGKSMSVSVTVQKENGYSYKGSKSLRPGNLDLIYEADTYTPPFYKGRSLFTHQSTITVAAIADFVESGTKLSKNKIVYTWKKDGEKLSDLSGVGKDTLVIQGKMIQRPFYVSVLAESLNSDLKAEKRILFNQINPNVVLYENNPIYGNIFEKALTGTFNFDREEVGITAVPYFFSTENRSSSAVKYSWFENGKKVGDETFGSFINYLNPNKEKSGVSNLKVEVEHYNNLLQTSTNSFLINVLGEQQSDTIEQNESTAF